MFNSPRRYHVVPVNDLSEHELTLECWCKPMPNEEHDSDAGRLIAVE